MRCAFASRVSIPSSIADVICEWSLSEVRGCVGDVDRLAVAPREEVARGREAEALKCTFIHSIGRIHINLSYNQSKRCNIVA